MVHENLPLVKGVPADGNSISDCYSWFVLWYNCHHKDHERFYTLHKLFKFTFQQRDGSKSRFASTQPKALRRRTSASRDGLWGVWLLGLAFHKRELTFHLYSFYLDPIFNPTLPPSILSLPFISLRGVQLLLPEPAAARLVLLRFDVVMKLELGLVWQLRCSVLQLPDREKEKERGRERQEVRSRGGGCVGWSTDRANKSRI